MEGIIQQYARHLQETEALTEQQALLKARYMAQEFPRQLIRDCEFGFRPRLQPYTEFEMSEVFAKEVAKADLHTNKYQLFSPLWLLFRKEYYTPGDLLRMGSPKYTGPFDDYQSVLQRKVVIRRLIGLSLLMEVGLGDDGRPRYRLLQENLENLRLIIHRSLPSIYQEPSDDDEYWEDQYGEGRLLNVLCKG
jgi:hypothetical protein